jgi:hypothetical protein
MRIKPLVTSPDDHISEHILCLNLASAVKAIMTELFGPNYDLDQLDMYAIRLEHAPLQTLTAAKLKSISDKYNIIPSEFLTYYPKHVNEDIDEPPTIDKPPTIDDPLTIAKPKLKRKQHWPLLQAPVLAKRRLRSQQPGLHPSWPSSRRRSWQLKPCCPCR